MGGDRPAFRRGVGLTGGRGKAGQGCVPPQPWPPPGEGEGSGLPLLLVPGLLCDAEVWAAQRDALGAKRCIVASHGDASSIEEMAEQALASMPPGPFALAGHSMGGRVALEIVRREGGRIARLALLDTGYQSLAPGKAGVDERTGRYALLEQARREGMEAMARQWARGMVWARHGNAPVFERIVAMVARRSPEEFAAQIEALLNRPDASRLLADIACPTLVACGRHDDWSPLARHREMKERIAGARLAVIEDAGHMTTMEQPERTARLLADWFSG